jgi:hypothetical protein
MNARIFWIVLAAVWISNSPSAMSQSHTPAETSKHLTAKDPSKTYFSLKKSFGTIPLEDMQGNLLPERYPEFGLSLKSCTAAIELYGGEDFAHGDRLPLTRALAELAFQIRIIESAAKAGHYPSQLWASDLSVIERQALSKLEHLARKGKELQTTEGTFEFDGFIPWAARNELAQKLNNYQRKLCCCGHRFEIVCWQDCG